MANTAQFDSSHLSSISLCISLCIKAVEVDPWKLQNTKYLSGAGL